MGNVAGRGGDERLGYACHLGIAVDCFVGENMRLSHLLQLGSLVCFAVVLLLLARKGVLKGRVRVLAFVALGCWALSWVASDFGW